MAQQKPDGRNSWVTIASISRERVRSINVEPNPRREGSPAIGGPPVSIHRKCSVGPDLRREDHIGDTLGFVFLEASGGDHAQAGGGDVRPSGSDTAYHGRRTIASARPALGEIPTSAPAIDKDWPPRS